MAAKGVAAKVVYRVVVDANRIRQVELVDGPNDVALPGAIVGNHVGQLAALGRRIFQVGTDRVDIQPRAVHKKAA